MMNTKWLNDLKIVTGFVKLLCGRKYKKKERTNRTYTKRNDTKIVWWNIDKDRKILNVLWLPVTKFHNQMALIW